MDQLLPVASDRDEPLSIGAPSATPSAGPAVSPQVETRSGGSKKWWIALGVVAVVLLGCCGMMFAAVVAPSLGSLTPASDTIALIHIDMSITGTGSGITPEYFRSRFSEALEDESVKAVVLRVDSPGGTVAASQEIARYVADSDKPVVVSVGDLCASGAYMVASQADRIVAMEGSSVGSIGVIMQIPNLTELLDKVGVDYQVLIAGDKKDEGSPFRSLTEEEIVAFQGELDIIHEQFIAVVAEGRGMDTSAVGELATGQTFLGSTALDNGLIDEIGTLSDAYEAASELAGIEGEYQVVDFDGYSGWLNDFLYGDFGIFSAWKNGSISAGRPTPVLK